MQLNLQNPIVIFDVESTGLDIVKDRIIEIAIIKIHTDQREEVFTQRINPTIPIPPEAEKIHHISNAEVAEKPTFAEVATKIKQFIEGCDIVGYNSSKFDIPILVEEFLRVGIEVDFSKTKFIDVQNIFHKMEQRTLAAAYKFYCNKELLEAHAAHADTRATYEVLQAQLDRYSTLENDVAFLSKFSENKKNVDHAGRMSYDEEGNEIFTFGKYKNKKVTEVLKLDTGYYGWIMKSDFPMDTKRALTKIRLRAFGQ